MVQISPVAGSASWNWSGNANINGQAPVTFTQPNLSVAAGTWYNAITQTVPYQLKTSGDSAITFLQDSNANHAYQIVHMVNGAATGGTISIQRIA